MLYYKCSFMSLDGRTLALIKQRLDEAERNLQYIKQALDNAELAEGTLRSADTEASAGQHAGDETPEGERIIEGVFDGKNMQGNDGQEYPVPPNYASKSKLVEGDVMKLTIGTDGSFVYKQIKPVERKRVAGHFIIDDHGKFGIKVDHKIYDVLLASVTFYKAEEGDEVTILVPEHGEAEWGAVDHVIHKAVH